MSIGICQFRHDDTPTSVIDRADAALYWAKQNGRDQVVCYDNQLASGELAAKPLPLTFPVPEQTEP